MGRRLLASVGVVALVLLALVLLCAMGEAKAQSSAEPPPASAAPQNPEPDVSEPAAPDDAADADDESEYEAPLLGIDSFRRGTETQLNSHMTGDLVGTHTTVFVKPLKSGETQIRVRFNNLRMPENGARYVLWAVGPDKSYTRLGHVDRPDRKLAAKLDARTQLTDFGLLITAESDAATQNPSGPVAALVVR